jgi:hypothetical protein
MAMNHSGNGNGQGEVENNGNGNGNGEPRSKLRSFQSTNPPTFTKSGEPLDADDKLRTMENNLEVAGVGENEKVLYTTHYLAGAARASWDSTCAMQANGYVMPWEEFKSKFSKAHVPMGLIKRMRDDFKNLKQGSLSIVNYRDKFLTLSRYAPDDVDTDEKTKERFLNGLHDEMLCVLVSICFVDLEAMVDSAIQMENKLNQASENCKRHMMYQGNSSNAQKPRGNPSSGFVPRPNRAPAPALRPNYPNRSGGNNFNRAPPRPSGNNFNFTTPRSGGAPTLPQPGDKSDVTCYGCGLKGHYSNECPKKMNVAPNPAATAQ